MIDIERTLRLLDVESESNFVQAEAIDAINYLLGENARLKEEVERQRKRVAIWVNRAHELGHGESFWGDEQ